MSLEVPPYPWSAPESQLDVIHALPAYTRTIDAHPEHDWDLPPVGQEHTFSLTKKPDLRWLTLSVRGRTTNQVDPPTFFQGGEIAGTLHLDLDQGQTIHEITIALCGRLTIHSHSASTFLYILKKVYSASDKGPTSSPSIFKRSRLQGRHDFPYSFRLPKGVGTISSDPIGGSAAQRHRLPPSFSDVQGNHVDVQYSLVVRVDHGGLRTGSKLVVPIKYTPIARPTPPTILRQLVYQQNSAVIGPDGDPTGWKTLQPIGVRGRLFKSMDVEAQCTMSISRPLTYTRGCPIHLFASIDTNNDQFSHLLSPESLHLALIQRIIFDEPADIMRFSRRLESRRTVKCHERATASWWREYERASPDYALDSTRRKVFAGEVLVPDDLVPACQILHYRHEYEIAIYPISAVGFTSAVPHKTALLSESVAIVTAYAQGPRPKSSILPQYGT